MRNDPLSIVARVIEEIGPAMYKQETRLLDPSPLVHGTDSRLMAEAMLGRAGGNRSLSLKLLMEDIKSRFPGFKAVRGFPGQKEWQRVRRMIYTICPTAKKKVAA